MGYIIKDTREKYIKFGSENEEDDTDADSN